MPKLPVLHPTVRGWLLDGPLAKHVPAYLARLAEGRYASNTVARSLGALAHFAHWMALCRLHEPDAALRRYRAPDSLVEFLKTL